MRKISFPLFIALIGLAVPCTWPQGKQAEPRGGNSISGRWLMTADFFGAPLNFVLELTQEGGQISGTADGNKLTGTLSGNAIQFHSKDDDGSIEDSQGTVQGDTISGTMRFIDVGNAKHPTTHAFTAKFVPEKTMSAQHHEFTPSNFYLEFSSKNKPVLTIAPGDSVHTTTVDADGTDEKSVSRVLGGNPQTGPFYVETTLPGDTLAVHFTRIRLNRDWALSDDGITRRGLDSNLARAVKSPRDYLIWHLDLQHGIATPEKTAEHLAKYSVPLRPMLGCVAVAGESNTDAPPSTHDSGAWGGNMDFNEIVEGATVYLPVQVPGALLYVGDGHAAQGDGELTGNALETSMDVEFTVDVIRDKTIKNPRVESATQVMAMGLGGSLDDAFRAATSNMADWLTEQYKLTPSEIAQVLGTSAEYQVSEVADRNAGIVLKIRKDRLQPLGASGR